ncbi:exonuclease SbcC [Hydrogenispora ethanolica]|uniref:Nuclease SbcCD subunit C n=1 Tax=Hydrogenispora ethanolica TaxID=1082276 RepID=A0A4R1SBE0_HYDET|nr:SMC family ATPase [Hydrogenispora ethanolica]TCL76866.1 exonuclease SbcC [Hydrogenispora ethanolica]
MRPLRVAIEGLHSFKERQEVDFAELAGAGLFGIFGPTGSGKSTILDAITLALYGSVKRAAKNTQGILNSQKDRLEVAFTFAIGPAEDRRSYRVERSFRRNKEKRDSVTAGVCRLIELGAGGETILADGPTEVTRRVEEIIGLTMEDFTRSVVLPQGEFSQFLKLRDADRVRMMERIFALAEYGSKLSEKVKGERERLGAELDRVDGILRELGNVSGETLQQLREELERKETERRAIVVRAEAVERDYARVAALWQLQEELERLRQAEREHLREQDAHRERCGILRRAEAAEAVRPYDEAQRRAAAACQDGRRELEAAAALYEAEEARHGRLAAALNAAETAFREGQPEWIARQARLRPLVAETAELRRKEEDLAALVAEQNGLAARVAEHQSRLAKGEKYKAEKEADRKRLEAELAGLTVPVELRERVQTGVRLEQEYVNRKAEVAKLSAARTDEAASRDALAERLTAERTALAEVLERTGRLETDRAGHARAKPGDLSSYAAERERLSHLERQLDALSALSAAIQAGQDELDGLDERLREYERRLEEGRTRSAEWERRSAGLETERQRRQAALQEHETANAAAVLAAGLAAGTPCPVCGSAHHPHPAAGLDPAALERERAELAELETQLERLRQAADQLNREMLQHQTRRAGDAEQQAKLREKQQAALEQWTELQAGLPAVWAGQPSERWPELLQFEKERLQALHEAIAAWEKRDGEWERELAGLRQQRLERERVVAQLGAELDACRNGLDRLERELAGAQDASAGLAAEYEALRAALGLSAGFVERSQQISAQDKASEEGRKKLAVIAGELEKAGQLYEKLQTELDTARAEWTGREADRRNLERELQERQDRLRAVTGGRPVEILLAEAEGALALLERNRTEAKTAYEASRESLQALANRRSAALQRQESAQAALDHAGAALNEQLSAHGFESAAAFAAALRTTAEREQLKAACAAFEDAAKKLAAQIEQNLAKLDGQTVPPEAWAEIQAVRGQAGAAKERIAGEIGGLESTLANMAAKYERIRQYQKDRGRLAGRKAQADEMHRLLQGDAFVAYIAEEHLRYILQDASGRLQNLTNGRYLLKLDENKDFIICDNGNGGLARPVSSLSGGETFLVSLALALALSAKIQLNGRNPLEFFFLDEGFGTLDPGLLEVVLDSLERLRQEHLVIGLISHLPELRNRIPRRLIIRPAGLDGAGSQVRVERG